MHFDTHPTHVVVDLQDGYTFAQDGDGKPFTYETANRFAFQRNSGMSGAFAGSYRVYRLEEANPRVEIIRIRFREDEVYEGDLPREAYENAEHESFDIYDLLDDGRHVHQEIVRILEDHGCTEPSATGGTGRGVWYSDPDGSQIINYATGEREEVSAHLYGVSDADEREVYRWFTGR